MRSIFGKTLLGIASFGSFIAMALFLVMLVTFERISDELLTVLWVLLICAFIIGRLTKRYFDSMVNRGEVEERERLFWKEKARHMGPLAAPMFWWRAIARPRARGALPENYSPPPTKASP